MHFGESVSDVEILQDIVDWHLIDWKRRGEKEFMEVSYGTEMQSEISRGSFG